GTGPADAQGRRARARRPGRPGDGRAARGESAVKNTVASRRRPVAVLTEVLQQTEVKFLLGGVAVPLRQCGKLPVQRVPNSNRTAPPGAPRLEVRLAREATGEAGVAPPTDRDAALDGVDAARLPPVDVQLVTTPREVFLVGHQADDAAVTVPGANLFLD